MLEGFQAFKVTFYSGLTVGTVLLNVFVIWTILRQQRHYCVRWGMNLLVLHLAIGDLVVGLTSTPTQISSSWLLQSRATCKIQAFISVVPMTSSSLLLIVMAWHRYNAIVCNNRSTSATLRLIVLSWLLAAVVSLPQLYAFELFEIGPPKSRTYVCDPKPEWFYSALFKPYLVCMFVVVVLLPLAASYIFYRKTVNFLNDPVAGRITRTLDTEADNIEAGRRRTTLFGIAYITCFVMCWAPYWLLTFYVFFFELPLNVVAMELSAMLTFSKALFNPLIFILYYTDQALFVNLIQRCCPKSMTGRRRRILRKRALSPPPDTANHRSRAHAILHQYCPRFWSRFTERGDSIVQEGQEVAQVSKHVSEPDLPQMDARMNESLDVDEAEQDMSCNISINTYCTSVTCESQQQQQQEQQQHPDENIYCEVGSTCESVSAYRSLASNSYTEIRSERYEQRRVITKPMFSYYQQKIQKNMAASSAAAARKISTVSSCSNRSQSTEQISSAAESVVSVDRRSWHDTAAAAPAAAALASSVGVNNCFPAYKLASLTALSHMLHDDSPPSPPPPPTLGCCLSSSAAAAGLTVPSPIARRSSDPSESPSHKKESLCFTEAIMKALSSQPVNLLPETFL